MPYELLEKELKSLLESYFSAIMDFIVLLKTHDDLAKRATPAKVTRKAGIGKDPDFYMAPDFDEIPECFKEYV